MKNLKLQKEILVMIERCELRNISEQQQVNKSSGCQMPKSALELALCSLNLLSNKVLHSAEKASAKRKCKVINKAD